MEVEEVNKTMQNFNLENELGKIKIPMPFTELMKNPSYKESVLKMIGSANSQPLSDTVNLQEENPKSLLDQLWLKKLRMKQVIHLHFTLHQLSMNK